MYTLNGTGYSKDILNELVGMCAIKEKQVTFMCKTWSAPEFAATGLRDDLAILACNGLNPNVKTQTKLTPKFDHLDMLGHTWPIVLPANDAIAATRSVVMGPKVA
jgi:hypothetical protein